MTQVLILPGIGGSGPEHWQTRWELLHPEYRRIEMPDWDNPELEVWVDVIENAVKAASSLPVLVAHSLGCMAVAHWAARGGVVRAALLVAIPDPSGPLYPAEAQSFSALPLTRLGFHTRVVASHDDPYGSFEHASRCASAWGSELCDVGRAGHINAQSALGDWPAGEALLRGLLA